MKHIFFIDPLEKLNIKKDSSLMMALSLKEQGEEVFLLFEEDFYISNENQKLKLFAFEGAFKDDGFYIAYFKLKDSQQQAITSADLVHMRIDPPFDERYLKYLWMLDYLKDQTGCKVLNAPLGIMKYNEKISAMGLNHSVPTYVGESLSSFEQFVEGLRAKGFEELILKPVDLYSGIGVQKISLDEDYQAAFSAKVKEYRGSIVAQPFIKEVLNGEYRSIYFDGEHLASIIKRPVPGQFLTNIAQGAKFEKAELPPQLAAECQLVADRMLKDGVRFIAFDLLGKAITEINVTCPGLIVEVSFAHKKNLAQVIAKKIKESV